MRRDPSHPERRGLALLGLLLVAGCIPQRFVSANVGSLPRSDQSKIGFLWMEPPGEGRYPLMLFLRGSGCASVTGAAKYFPPVVDVGFGVVAPETRGVRLEDTGQRCSEEYLATNDRAQRVDDVLTLLPRLRGMLPRWDGRLVAIGESEGGTIAPEVAFRFPGTIAVASLSSGGLEQAEEMKMLAEKRLRAEGASAAQIEAALDDLGRIFSAIKANPTYERSWNGKQNTYKRWASYLWYRSLDYYGKLEVPIYLAHGERDTMAPVESADAVAVEFRRLGKTNLTYRRYPRLDHDYRDEEGGEHFQEIGQDLLRWLRTVKQ